MPLPKDRKEQRTTSNASRTKYPSDSHRSSSSVAKTEILINVYDLLPPGKLASTLWFLGSSLLHTGVVVKSLNREYAFGKHDQPNLSGVYWTKPHMEPPGGTFRCELLQGFTLRPDHEIETIIREVSEEFSGPSYSLLSNNCNHFTSYLCGKLTGKPAAAWLNRAASIGLALPCVVPREWIEPPDHDTADGELLEEEEDDERTSMLRHDRGRLHSFHSSTANSENEEWDHRRDRSQSKSREGKGKERGRD